MTKCPNCNAEQTSESPKFCFECGYNFKQTSEQATASAKNDIEEKLAPFDYDDLGNGKYSIERIKDRFTEAVEIPEGVVEIGVIAFSGCTLLRSLTLPKSLLTVRSGAFEKCTALEEVVFLSQKCTLEGSLFSGCSELKKVVLPSGLTVIPGSLFTGASSLKELTLPETVKKIENFAFQGTSIETITVPTSIEFLDSHAFAGGIIKTVRYMGTRAQWDKVTKEGLPYQNAKWRDFRITFAEKEEKGAASQGQGSATELKTKAAPAKKAKPQKINGKTKENLLWEIRVCKEAVQKKEKALITSFSDVMSAILRILLLSPFCAIIPALIFFEKINNGMIKERLPHIILIAVGLATIVSLIMEYSFKRKNTQNYSGKECLEVLTERLRIAKLLLNALEEGRTPSEAETKYRLSFFDADVKKCVNCAYMGKTIKETTTHYSDGTTETSSSVDHYFCQKLDKAHVKKNNVCNNYFPKRVAGAIDAANRYYAKIEEELREKDKRKANGFR